MDKQEIPHIVQTNNGGKELRVTNIDTQKVSVGFYLHIWYFFVVQGMINVYLNSEVMCLYLLGI